MDTRNWFGEHASAIKLIALAGGIALAAIVLLDMLTHKKSTTTGATPATGADTSPATSGASDSSTLQNPGETFISVLEDYSSHVNTTDAPTPTTLPPVHLPTRPTIQETTPGSAGLLPPTIPGGFAQPNATAGAPVVAATSPHGATTPIPTPHPSEQYTVRSGDTLWGIAQRFLGNGADWQELYTWNRSTVGSNANLIYPGEVLTV